MAVIWGVAVVALVALALCRACGADGAEPQVFMYSRGRRFAFHGAEEFVKVDDGRLRLGCHDFFFAGWNSWQLLEAAAGKFGADGPETIVQYSLDRSVANGLRVFRMFGHTVDVEPDGEWAMQLAPGKYNEAILRAFDSVLHEAGRRGMKVIVSLINNWKEPGSVSQFARWCGEEPDGKGESSPGFFTNPACRAIFKDHISFLVNRRNTITGRRYKDDPAIMAWNLINEHRYYFESCEECNEDDMLPWIEDISSHLRAQDPNHLITVGEEGFYKDGPRDFVNPIDSGPQPTGPWPEKMGQDFLRDHSPRNIDFTAIHAWPDNWKDVRVSFVRRWIREHDRDARRLGKPLVVEEFGKTELKHTDESRAATRDPFFKAVFQEVESSAKRGGSVMGVMFWEWKHNGRTDWLVYDVRESDTTWQLIRDNAAEMNALTAASPRRC